MGWTDKVTPRPLYPRERPGTHCKGGLMDPRADLDGPPPGLDPRTAQPVASRHTDWAIPAYSDVCIMTWSWEIRTFQVLSISQTGTSWYPVRWMSFGDWYVSLQIAGNIAVWQFHLLCQRAQTATWMPFISLLPLWSASQVAPSDWWRVLMRPWKGSKRRRRIFGCWLLPPLSRIYYMSVYNAFLLHPSFGPAYEQL
jgi:hypothetical protein